MSTLRVAVGAAGVALMGVGAFLLGTAGDVPDVLVWLAGAVALHDAVVAPAILLTGLLLVRGGVRGPVRGGLLVAGALTVVALPVLLRPGRTANPSVLPLDYPRNWLIALGVVAAVTVLWAVGRRLGRGRSRRDD